MPTLTAFSGKSSITVVPQTNAPPPLLQRQGGHTTAGELTLQLRNMMHQTPSGGIHSASVGQAKEGASAKGIKREKSTLPSSETEVLLKDAAYKYNKNSDETALLKLPSIK